MKPSLKRLLITSAVPLVAIMVLLASLWMSRKAIQTPIRLTPKAQQESVSLFFVPSSLSLPPDDSISLWMDPQGHPISFVRFDLTFNPAIVQLTPNITTATSLATTVIRTPISQANSTGQFTIALSLTPQDRNNPPTSVFEVIRLFFTTGTASSGSTSLTFGPTNQVVDLNVTNLAFNSPSANIDLAVGPSATPTPTGATTNVGGAIQPTGIPNSCGGTCSSNSNCQSSLICHTGFCRNPSCPSSPNCVCPSPTPLNGVNISKTPTPTKSPAKPTLTETPKPIENFTLPTEPLLELPSTTPTLSPANTPTPTPPPSLIAKAGLPAIVGIFGLICLWLLYKVWFKRRSPPPPLPPHPG